MGQRRRSYAAQVVGDAAHAANKLPWWGTALLGVALFVLLYWILPWWVQSRIEGLRSGPIRLIFEDFLGRRVHWLQYIGIALALICGFFAVRNYFRADRLKSSRVRDVGFVGRVVARFLD